MASKLRIVGKLTPREQLLVETESGVAVTAIMSVLNDPERPKVRLLSALLLVALRRDDPKATLDDVLDGDYELEFEPEVSGGPLPPPSAPAG